MNASASAIASELRKLADSLDKHPEALLPAPNIYFSCSYQGETSKELFLNVARCLPRPLVKEYKTDEVWIKYNPGIIHVSVYVQREHVCTLIEPAKPAVYRCEPLLSDEEADAIVAESISA